MNVPVEVTRVVPQRVEVTRVVPQRVEVTRQVPVEVTRVVEVEVEVTREVPVEIIKEVEVIKEVPIEVIKEVEIIREKEIEVVPEEVTVEVTRLLQSAIDFMKEEGVACRRLSNWALFIDLQLQFQVVRLGSYGIPACYQDGRYVGD